MVGAVMILPLILHRFTEREHLMTGDDFRIVAGWFGGLAVFVAIFLALAMASIRPAKAETLLPHPRGCPPVRFCACGVAVELFGAPIRALWPSAAWLKFPRAEPAPDMVAVRRGHIFILKRHLRGSVWMVNDYNSGGHRSRHHARSIAGFVVVNPHASNVAGL